VTASSSTSTYGTPVTYSATVSVPSPGTGLPTGTASFSDGGSPIAACQNVPLSGGVATCTTTPPAGTNQIEAVYTGDSNYATSTGSLAVPVANATLTVTAANASRLFGRPNPAFTATITGFLNGDTQKTAVTGSPACTTTAQQQSTGGTYAITCTAGTLQSSNYTFAFVPGTLTGTYTSVISGTSHSLVDVIKPGESVEIAPGAHVFGLIIVEQGASLDIESASLLADIYLQQPATVRVCGATAAGAIAVEDGTGPVVIGDPSNGCAGNKIVGLVDVQGNTNGVTVTGNTIDGSLTVLGNRGTIVDQPNTVHGFTRLQ
jgi:MBG domain (YGX type)/Bacterial Ig-like domain (group 3)